MSFKIKHIVIYLSVILSVFIHPCRSQEKDSTALEKTVTKYLLKSRNAGDIEKLVSILDNRLWEVENALSFVPSINPLNPKKLKRFSSKFGKRFHPIDRKNKPHFGLDISADAGTPIHATASGTVKTVTLSNKGYGNQVVLVHDYGFKTRYAHMYLFIVKEGQPVKKGEVIGFVGSTGKSTANHIHYEIWKNGTRIDPYPFCMLDL